MGATTKIFIQANKLKLASRDKKEFRRKLDFFYNKTSFLKFYKMEKREDPTLTQEEYINTYLGIVGNLEGLCDPSSIDFPNRKIYRAYVVSGVIAPDTATARNLISLHGPKGTA